MPPGIKKLTLLLLLMATFSVSGWAQNNVPETKEAKVKPKELARLLGKKTTAKDDGDYHAEAMASFEISEYCKKEGLIWECLKFMEEGVKILRQINSLEELPDKYLKMSGYYQQFGYLDKAMDACTKGLATIDDRRYLTESCPTDDASKLPSYDRTESKLLDKMVVLSNLMEDHQKAIIATRKLIRITQKESKSENYATRLTNIGVSHLKLEQPDSAEFYFRKSTFILEKLDEAEKQDTTGKQSLNRYVSNLVKFNLNLAQSLIKQRKYQEADKILNKIAGTCKEHKLIPFESEIYYYKSLILFYRNDLQAAFKASSYAVTLSNLVMNTDKFRIQQMALSRHAIILKKLSDFKEASLTLEKLAKLKDEELKEQKKITQEERENREQERKLEEQFDEISDLEKNYQENRLRIELEKENEKTKYIIKQKTDSINYSLEISKRQYEINQANLLQKLQKSESERLKNKIKTQKLALSNANLRKETAERDLESKRKEANREKNERKKQEDEAKKEILLYLIGIIILVIAVTASAYISIDKTKLNRRLKEGQQQIEQANMALGSLNRQLAGKNKSITDSIQYARGIQAAILPGENRWMEAFPDSFVYYVPKDIVSGDFYFLSSQDNLHILAFADCTGHGVPGALMSIIGHNLLTSAIGIHDLNNPAEILSFMDQGLRNTLQQEGKESQDGMEVGICAFDLNKGTLEFAGSRRPLYGMLDGEFFEWKGDRHYLGSGKTVFRDFTNFSCELDKLSEVWMTSDGYPDQFGGPELKRFHSGKLRQLLASLAGQSAESQKEVLAKTFTDWKINTAQLDDVMVIGVRPEAMRKS